MADPLRALRAAEGAANQRARARGLLLAELDLAYPGAAHAGFLRTSIERFFPGGFAHASQYLVEMALIVRDGDALRITPAGIDVVDGVVVLPGVMCPAPPG